MGSIYEYKLQYVPNVGRCVPGFITVHEIIPYCVYTDTHFGYAESGCSGKDTIEYNNKRAFAARIQQIHSLSPFTYSAVPESEPVEWTLQEVEDFIDEVWRKTETINAVVDGDIVYDYYYNDYEIQHWFVNLGIEEDDNREVTAVTPASIPDEYDVYWPAPPELVDGGWRQKWYGRTFTQFELEQYRIEKNKKINDERYIELSGGFYSTVFDKYIDSDERSRSNIATEVQNCILSVARDEPTYDITWRVADDSYITVTRDQFLQMNNELAEFTQQVYQTSWDRKAAVDVATTRASIDGV